MGLPACPSSNCPPHWEEPLLRSPGVYICSHDLDVTSVSVSYTLSIFCHVTGVLFTFHVSEAKLGKAGEAETILTPQLEVVTRTEVELSVPPYRKLNLPSPSGQLTVL